MPRFRVIQYRDACVRYEVELDAETAQAALEHAKTQDCDWVDCGFSTYDNADMEVVDAEGVELIPSHQVW